MWETKALMAEGKGYDLPFLFMLGMKLLIQRSVGLVIPSVSKWAAKNKYICTEFVENIIGLNNSIELTPGQLGTALIDTGVWKLIRQPIRSE
jgi:hypothetical protein